MGLSVVTSSVAIIGSLMAVPAYADGGVRSISSGENSTNPFIQVPAAAPIAFNSASRGNTSVPSPSTAGLVNSAGGAAFLQNVAGTPAAVRYEAGTTRPVGEVPEPGTWAMMLVGFGVIGYAMRRPRPADVSFS